MPIQETELYVLDASTLQVSDHLLSRLSEARQKKVLAFRFEAGRKLSLGAGLLLDHALRRHGLDERTASITTAEHGKPVLQGTDIHFNLSHSGTLVACALSPCPVGVDVERNSRRISETLLRHVCSAEEIEKTSSDPLSFFDIWTAKEALLKMTGEGINGDLRTLDITSARTWRLPQGYSLSVCVSNQNLTLDHFDFVTGINA